MFIFAKESKKGVKIFVPEKKFFEKKVTRGSLRILDLSNHKLTLRLINWFFLIIHSIIMR